MQKKAFLALEDGTVFYGYSNFKNYTECAEIVFNTAMTGYQEVCTDPSYANQMVVFTVSHVGNVGVNDQDYESNRIWVKGLIVREMSKFTSNWRAKHSLIDFLNKNNIPWIEGIDTRKLVRHLRKTGCQNGCILIGEENPTLAIQRARGHLKADGLDLSTIAIQKDIYDWGPPEHIAQKPLICVYDFGVKLNILRKLEDLGCHIKVIPSNYSADDILMLRPAGIVLSNGPGDPSCNKGVIENIKKLIYSHTPVLGICFGCQLIGIAAGGETVKMKFGHHGTNHPVYDLAQQRVYITSQNHNFMVNKLTFPKTLEITHISLFDQSIQGLCLKGYPVIGFQGHPEGSPGPQDISNCFFEEFFHQVKLKTHGESLSCL